MTWQELLEAWGAAARKASADARRRRKIIPKLEKMGQKAMGKFVDQWSKEKEYARIRGVPHKPSKLAKKDNWWTKSSQFSTAARHLKTIKPTDSRTPVERLLKRIKRIKRIFR